MEAKSAIPSTEPVAGAPAAGPDPRDRFLVELRDWLYDGDWSGMLADLTAVLAGRPYVFELFADVPEPQRRRRVAEDIERIHRLSALDAERRHPSVSLEARRRGA
jgi:hypothetical protein